MAISYLVIINNCNPSITSVSSIRLDHQLVPSDILITTTILSHWDLPPHCCQEHILTSIHIGLSVFVSTVHYVASLLLIILI